jgi:hypothetical protein
LFFSSSSIASLVNFRHQQLPRFCSHARKRDDNIGGGGREGAKTIEHTKPKYSLSGIPEIAGTFGCHIQKFRIVPLEMLDNLPHACFRPTVIELLSNQFTGLFEVSSFFDTFFAYLLYREADGPAALAAECS